MKNPYKIIFAGIGIIVMMGSFYSCKFRSWTPQMAQMEAPAEDVYLTDLSGATKTLSEIRAGRPAVILFWATWCPHCREQISELPRDIPRMEQKGIAMILVNVGESPEEVSSYLKSYPNLSNVYLDEDSQAADTYNIPGIPMYFYIDAQGEIKDSGFQWAPGSAESLLGV